MADSIPINIPPAPRFPIGNKKPCGTVAKYSDNAGVESASCNSSSLAAGPVNGTIVNK